MKFPINWRIVIIRLPAVFFLLYLITASTITAIAADFSRKRQQMVDLIEDDVRATSAYIGKSKLNPGVMEAMRTVDRHEFVPEDQIPYAYENRPLAIGYGQTISQPYIVALMTDLLDISADSRVLEVGTGSGYQAAVLAKLVSQVYTIEIIEGLGQQAKVRLQNLSYQNVHCRIADGYYGWEEQAPFDGIMVTAAATHVPPSLLKQLKPGGRMVIPVGSRFLTQQLLLILKDHKGKLKTRQILPVRFVPFTGEH